MDCIIQRLISFFKILCDHFMSFVFENLFKNQSERHDLKTRLWLFFSPFLFPPKERGKKKRRMKNRDQKSCLSARSSYRCQFTFLSKLLNIFHMHDLKHLYFLF